MIEKAIYVDRQDLLEAVNQLNIGVAGARVLVSQADCISIKDGFLNTFNDQISVSVPLAMLNPDLTDYLNEGVINAGEFIRVVNNISTDVESLEIRERKDKNGVRKLVLTSSNKFNAEFVISDKIVMEYLDPGKIPNNFNSLSKGFEKALGLVASTCAKDNAHPITGCVQILFSGPDSGNPSVKMLSTDNVRITRVQAGNGHGLNLNKDSKVITCLLPQLSANKLSRLHLTKYTVSDSWVHFTVDYKSEAPPTVINCRIAKGAFPEADKVIEEFNVIDKDANYNEVTFTDEIEDAVGFVSSIFNSKSLDYNTLIDVLLDEHGLHLKSKSERGSGVNYRCNLVDNIKDEVQFTINPTFLLAIFGKGKVEEEDGDSIEIGEGGINKAIVKVFIGKDRLKIVCIEEGNEWNEYIWEQLMVRRKRRTDD